MLEESKDMQTGTLDINGNKSLETKPEMALQHTGTIANAMDCSARDGYLHAKLRWVRSMDSASVLSRMQALLFQGKLQAGLTLGTPSL